MRSLSQFVGVDFSGGVLAGKKIWLASGVVEARRLVVQTCHPVTVLTGGDPQRDTALAALRSCVAASPATAIGCDFPFSLPTSLIEAGSWQDFVEGFGRRFPTPQAFRAFCRSRDGQHERKRATEIAARVPFAAYNLRLYRQTFYGIRDFLAPLVAARQVTVMPMMVGSPGKPILMEVCPASALKRLGLYHPYKGRGDSMREARLSILRVLLDDQELALADTSLRDRACGDVEGDALDSILAAAIAFWTFQSASGQDREGQSPLIEGRVYA